MSSIVVHICHLCREGWTTTDAGAISDALLRARRLLAIRGLMVDGVYLNTRENRIALKLEKKPTSKKDRND